MNRRTNTLWTMLTNPSATEQDFYPGASFDTLRVIDEAIRLNSLHLGRSTTYVDFSFSAQTRIPHQNLELDDIARGLLIIRESYPRVADRRTRQVPTHQEQSRLTQDEQNKALKKLKKEFYIPKPKRTAMRLYYREDPINNTSEKEDEDLKRCAICLEDFEREEVLVTPCKHMFHEDCIVPWLKSHGQCPVCRFAIEGRK